MSVTALNHNSRLSDALERDLMRQAIAAGEATSIVDLCKSVLATLKKGVVALYDFVVDVAVAMDDARAKDRQFTGTQW
ncbi:hypothetical protein ERD78_05340 [Allopusillimonas soli]|uniref:Uncharacterized protein n=1 Tax=Allopusillimonas soli TaxID=659016 RepID=A0A853F8H6_9BURK|nr:hypothetical protein [Allopusillimonas soli]NYT36287.1 hypothetical protein [Allopusillimonas soli]TEA76611.1 hypothetical protein ERD78_05340 [Allopusillimonas soli]